MAIGTCFMVYVKLTNYERDVLMRMGSCYGSLRVKGSSVIKQPNDRNETPSPRRRLKRTPSSKSSMSFVQEGSSGFMDSKGMSFLLFIGSTERSIR